MERWEVGSSSSGLQMTQAVIKRKILIFWEKPLGDPSIRGFSEPTAQDLCKDLPGQFEECARHPPTTDDKASLTGHRGRSTSPSRSHTAPPQVLDILPEAAIRGGKTMNTHEYSFKAS